MALPPFSAFQTLQLPANPEGIAEAAELLRNGGVVGMPTETVYGLAGNALDPDALAKIFAAKARPTFDPLIVHLASFPGEGIVELDRLPPEARARVFRLAEGLWPGPLTLVLPRGPRIPDLCASGLPTVGVRVPSHPVARALLAATGFPLAAPSANRFGRVSPTRAEHVMAELGGRIPLVLDGGEAEVGLESTVVAVEPNGTLRRLRPGAIDLETLERVSGGPVLEGMTPGRSQGSARGERPAAPGMLESHYAPAAQVQLLSGPLSQLEEATLQALLPPSGVPVALLLQAPPEAPEVEAARERVQRLRQGASVGVQALGGTPAERARNLFAALRALDDASAPGAVILAEPAPTEDGLDHAINDRLRRASAPREGSWSE